VNYESIEMGGEERKNGEWNMQTHTHAHKHRNEKKLIAKNGT
jgi:hypothetical protein